MLLSYNEPNCVSQSLVSSLSLLLCLLVCQYNPFIDYNNSWEQLYLVWSVIENNSLVRKSYP